MLAGGPVETAHLAASQISTLKMRPVAQLCSIYTMNKRAGGFTTPCHASTGVLPW